MEKLPYPKLNFLMKPSNKHKSSYHFNEAVLFFNTTKVSKSIYIHSAPEELVLLIGAITEDRVKIILSEEYPEKDIVLTNYVFNNIEKKIHEEVSG